MNLLPLDEVCSRLNITPRVLMLLIRNHDLPSILLNGEGTVIKATWQEMVAESKYPEHCERKVSEADLEQWCEHNPGLMKSLGESKIRR